MDRSRRRRRRRNMFRNVQEAVTATLFRGRTNLVITSHTCCSSTNWSYKQVNIQSPADLLIHSPSLKYRLIRTADGVEWMSACSIILCFDATTVIYLSIKQIRIPGYRNSHPVKMASQPTNLPILPSVWSALFQVRVRNERGEL